MPAELVDAADWVELAPLMRRAVGLDAGVLVRLQSEAGVLTAWVQLPFDVLAARSVRTDADPGVIDVAVGGADVLAWLDGASTEPPARLDIGWRTALPPRQGWRRLDRIPDEAIRALVRAGAREIKALGGTAPRTEQALLDAVVLTVSGEGLTAPITLRTVAALTRMGFLPRDSQASVDAVGRWIRVAAAYGSVYAERPGAGLTVLR
jgi:hypothetical protein